MAVKAVVFDVGETLIDETAPVGARGRRRRRSAVHAHGRARRARSARRAPPSRLGDARRRAARVDLGRGATSIPTRCLACEQLRSQGFLVGAVGNTLTATEELLREHVDLIGSSARWGVEKPAPEFFERIVAESGCRRRRDRLRRRPRRQRHPAGDRRGHGRGPHPPRAVGPPVRRAAARDPDPLARRAPGGARCLSSGSASASTRTRSRTACGSCSAASRSSIRAGSRGTPTAT